MEVSNDVGYMSAPAQCAGIKIKRLLAFERVQN